MEVTSARPRGEAAIRILAMPRDANPAGDIFGGWLMSHMDMAGAAVAVQHAGERVVTVAVDAMTFLKPVFVGDVVSFYGELVRTGRTSLEVRVKAWARRGRGGKELRVTVGTFTFVVIGDDRRPRSIAGGAASAAVAQAAVPRGGIEGHPDGTAARAAGGAPTDLSAASG